MAKKPTKVKVTDEAPDEDAPLEEQSLKKTVVDIKPPVSDLPKPTVVKSASGAAKKPIPRWVWYVVGGAVLLIIVAIAGWAMFGGSKSTVDITTTVEDTNASTETLVPRVLDGVPVAAAQAFTNIYAVVIENLTDSRPPSGLDKASVIYEALTEGGITRFLALFPVGQPADQIGPVRSARPYFVSWAEEYKPLFVHAGGSPQALSYLKSSKANVYDFNQFVNGGNFMRDKSRTAPHNLYTNPDLLFAGLRHRAPDAKPTYTSWLFKGETPLDNRPTVANDIVINFSSFNYKVTYTYDRVQNQYIRQVAEKPHVTRDGVPLAAKDIIVQFTKIGLLPNEKQRLDITTVGSGKMLLFRDGTVTEGTWKKDSNVARTQFLDVSGNPLALNPGQIWIESVSTDAKVTY